MTKTEAKFKEMIAGVRLTPEERAMLRHDCGLSYDQKVLEPHLAHEVLKTRMKMKAWAKLDKKDKKPVGQRGGDLSGPVLDKIRKEAEDIGFNDLLVIGHGVILDGLDHMKACRLKEFRDAITGGTGFINRGIAQRNMPAAQRVLLKHLVEKLKAQGAVVVKEETYPDYTFTVNVDETEVRLGFLPY